MGRRWAALTTAKRPDALEWDDTDEYVVLAARWGQLFRCDPMSFLDRPASDLPVLLAIMRAAVRDIERAKEAAKRA